MATLDVPMKQYSVHSWSKAIKRCSALSDMRIVLSLTIERAIQAT